MPSQWQEGRTIAAMSKKKPERMTLPDGLRLALKNSGKTSYQLMAETGVNHGVILRFMKGERDIRLETAEKLAAAVGLTVEVPPVKKNSED
jgi:hypothetical protein